jgi:hypothetical protein
VTRDPKRQRVEAKAAKDVAAETLRSAAQAEWLARRDFMRQSRGQDLTLPQETSTHFETVVQAIHARALTVLDDIQCHDPDPKYRIAAADSILRYDLERRRIVAELDAKHPQVVEHKPQPGQLSDGVPREEKVAILRKLALVGGA